MTTMRNRHVTAGTYRVHVGRHKPDWIVGIRNMMQHIDREHGDWSTQVKQPRSPDGIEHLLRLAQVSVHNSGIVVTSQQIVAPRHDTRFHIDVHHATIRCEILRYLMHVARGRQARSEIQELPHSHSHQIPHHTTQ